MSGSFPRLILATYVNGIDRLEYWKESLVTECRGWPHIRGDPSEKSFWDKLAAIGTWARFSPDLLR
jgi:hypothetical protein